MTVSSKGTEGIGRGIGIGRSRSSVSGVVMVSKETHRHGETCFVPTVDGGSDLIIAPSYHRLGRSGRRKKEARL